MAAGKRNVWGELRKILNYFLKKEEAEAFKEPVRWKEWGLLDYPKIISKPMDLGTIKAQLDEPKYTSPMQFHRDMLLVWENCQTYNQDGSALHKVAAKLKKAYLDRWNKLGIDDNTAAGAAAIAPPSLSQRKAFAQAIYSISSEDLGRLVMILDQRCEAAIRKINADDIEIDIDSIDPATFWAAEEFVRSKVAGEAKRGRKAGGGAASKKRK